MQSDHMNLKFSTLSVTWGAAEIVGKQVHVYRLWLLDPQGIEVNDNVSVCVLYWQDKGHDTTEPGGCQAGH